MLLGWLDTLLNLWHLLLSLSFLLFFVFRHFFSDELELLRPLVQEHQLLSEQASVVLISWPVCVSRSHALEVDNVSPFVGASDAFDFHAARYLNLFAVAILDLVRLDVHVFSNLSHHLMELRVSLDSLLVVNGPVLCE